MFSTLHFKQTGYMVQIDRISQVVSTLSNDGLILFPTDTVWGIGCDCKSEVAIRSIFKLKQRPFEKKFILLADSIHMVKDYVSQVHPRIETLLQYHNRPLTVIYNEGKNLPDILINEDNTVAFRVVNDPICKALIQNVGRPIVFTAANLETESFPKNFGAISSTILQGVDHVVQSRQLDTKESQPSVIVRLTDKKELEFIRE